MASIHDIAAAFAALANALPRSPKITVNLHGCDDSTLVALVDAGASRARYENEARTEEWDCADLRVHNVGIAAFGQHRAIVPRAIVAPARLDSEAVDAALAQAAEAIRSRPDGGAA